MTGLVRKTLILAAGIAVVGSMAYAGVPDPRNSTVESVCLGTKAGLAFDNDGAGADRAGFEVTVRDVNSAPLSNRTVVLDFSATTIKLQQAQNAGTTFNCTSKTLSKLTNASGDAIFAGRFGGYANTNSVEVRADGVVLASVKGRSTDIDGAGANGATNSADLNLFRLQFFATQPAAAQTDFNFDTNTNTADLNIFRQDFFDTSVGAAYCP